MIHPPPSKLPGQQGEWRVVKELGANANSTIKLWHLVDSNEKVLDRRISKNIIANPTHDVILRGPGKNQLREVFISQVLAPSGISPTEMVTVPITDIRRLQDTPNCWAAYMPYFAMESLTQFINKQDVRIPEPFAWYMFQRLAKACVLMDEALRSESKHYKIVHVDLKPENIFMMAPGSLGKDAPFPLYPPIYVGDFGSAQITFDGEDTSKKRFIGWGTTGWLGPELAGYNIDGNTPPPEPWQQSPSSYTNIWQAGMIMLRSLKGEVFADKEPDWNLKEVQQQTPSYHDGSIERMSDYSNDLLYLIESCLHFRPKFRLTPRELLKQIEAQMYNHTDGMESWGTDYWFKEKETELISANYEAEHKVKAKFISSPEHRRKSYVDKFPAKFAAVQKRWRRIVAKQIKEGKRVMEWSREEPLSPLDATDGEGVLTKGAEVLLCKPENMLFHDTIDKCFDVDTCWDSKDPDPVVFGVEEEYAKVWIEERRNAR